MPNRLASYKNPETLELVHRWFKTTYGNTAQKDRGFYTVSELYQSFSEYTIDPEYADRRLNLQEFAKCLVACKIIDIGGVFMHRPEYAPKPSAITRATA